MLDLDQERLAVDRALSRALKREACPDPVEDVDQAVRWLWARSNPADWLDDGALPLEAQLACDVFWISEHDLRAKLKRERVMMKYGAR